MEHPGGKRARVVCEESKVLGNSREQCTDWQVGRERALED